MPDAATAWPGQEEDQQQQQQWPGQPEDSTGQWPGVPAEGDSWLTTAAHILKKAADKIGIPTSLDDITSDPMVQYLAHEPSPVQLPRAFPETQSTIPGQVGAAIMNFPADAWNFLTSPGGAALTLATAGSAPLVQRAVALGFTADQIRSGLQADNLQDQVEAAIGAAIGAHGTLHEFVNAEPKKISEPKPAATSELSTKDSQLSTTSEGGEPSNVEEIKSQFSQWPGVEESSAQTAQDTANAQAPDAQQIGGTVESAPASSEGSAESGPPEIGPGQAGQTDPGTEGLVSGPAPEDRFSGPSASAREPAPGDATGGNPADQPGPTAGQPEPAEPVASGLQTATTEEPAAGQTAPPDSVRAAAMSSASAAEPSSPLSLGIVPRASPFVTEDVVPAFKKVGNGILSTFRDIRNVFSPPNAGPAAKLTAGNIRENAAQLARNKEIAATKLADAAQLFRRTSNTFNLDVIDRLETGRDMGNPGLEAYKSVRKAAYDERIAQVRTVNPNALQNLIEDYFPHIWTKESVDRLLGNPASIDPNNPWASMFGKRPLEGSKSFLRQRSIPTTMEGIALGLEPVTYNPVELDLAKMHEMDRYVMGQKIVQEMSDSGLTKMVRAGAKGPAGYTQINDRVARVFAPKEWKIVNEAGEEMPGQKLLGHLYAPDDAARVINNYLSPGLRGNAFYDALRAVGNTMNQVQLGLSLYHAAFTSIDAATSTMALGIEQVARSGFRPEQILRGTGNIVRAMAEAPVGGGLVENMWRGNKFLREYSKPGSTNAELAKIVDAAVAGGARVRMDTFYKTGAVDSFFKAIKSGSYAGAALRAPFAAIEAAAKPLMEYVVPRMKLGIISQMAEYELGKLPPGASRADVRTVIGRVVDSVDNRMGQMIYDNLFWNKVLKDGLMASVRSVGWNVGDIRELGGGVLDTLTVPRRAWQSFKDEGGPARNPVMTHRMAYLVSLPMMVGMLGSIYQYLKTGQGPQDLQDAFMPRTGRIKPDGTPERVMLPTYMKDIAPLALAGARRGAMGFIDRLGQMAMNKLHPLYTMIGQMLQNKDYYGVEIHNENDGLVETVKKEAAFVLKQFRPFSFQGVGQREGGPIAKSEAIIGIMPTPRELTSTAAEDMAQRFYVNTLPQGARTQDQFDKSAALRTLVEQVRGGDKTAIGNALANRQIRPDQITDVMKRANESPLQYRVSKITPDQAMQVWAVATPAEKNQIREDLVRKMLQTKTLGPQQRFSYIQTLRSQ